MSRSSNWALRPTQHETLLPRQWRAGCMHPRRPSPPSIIASVALFFALGGTATAAHQYLITSTSQIKPSVLKKLKGKAGPASTNGTNGANGREGKEGPRGVAGANGTDGAT